MVKLKIVSKTRFITSLVLLLLISYLLVYGLLKINVVEGIAESEFIEIHVKSGDTLWDLAKKFSPENQDIRKSLYEINTLNNLSSSEIYPGQIIKIPLD